MDEEARWRAEALTRQLQADEFANLASEAASAIYQLIGEIEAQARKGCEREPQCITMDTSSLDIYNYCDCLAKLDDYSKERNLAGEIRIRTMFR